MVMMPSRPCREGVHHIGLARRSRHALASPQHESHGPDAGMTGTSPPDANSGAQSMSRIIRQAYAWLCPADARSATPATPRSAELATAWSAGAIRANGGARKKRARSAQLCRVHFDDVDESTDRRCGTMSMLTRMSGSAVSRSSGFDRLPRPAARGHHANQPVDRAG